jgi:hypothetical protein
VALQKVTNTVAGTATNTAVAATDRVTKMFTATTAVGGTVILTENDSKITV